MPRSNFDPYAGMSAEEKAALRGSPRERKRVRFEARGGKAFQQGRSEEMSRGHMQAIRAREMKHTEQLQQQIDALTAERDQKMELVAEIDQVLSEI